MQDFAPVFRAAAPVFRAAPEVFRAAAEVFRAVPLLLPRRGLAFEVAFAFVEAARWRLCPLPCRVAFVAICQP